MKKRVFLKNSSLIIGGTLFHPTLSCTSNQNSENLKIQPLKNWAENFEFSTTNVYTPNTVAEVQDLVRRFKKVRVLGSRHSFNRIADSDENLISCQNLNRIVSLDADKMQVTVEGGIKYGELCKHLSDAGYALHNLASLPHISVAGTIATATHGSGFGNGNLSTGVAAIELVNGRGELVNLVRDKDPDFYGAVVGLGGLGVVTKVTLDLVPTFDVAQVIYRNLPMASLRDHFKAIMGAGYSVSLFTDWKSDVVNQVWVKKKVENGIPTEFSKDFFGATLATEKLHPVEAIDAESCSEQLGMPGPWYERLPHFKSEFQPSAGKELQAEYFVPLEAGYAALTAMASLSNKISPHVFISEIRSIKGDEFWMSPCYKQDSIALHTTWKQDIPEVMELLPQIESQLLPYQAKPHWAKLFTVSHENLKNSYSNMEAFKNLLSKYDPNEKFRNAYLNEHIYGI